MVDILREYCNPQSLKFGNAQSAYPDLCNHFSGRATAHVMVTQLEMKLTTMWLNCQWNKMVTAFVTHISQLIHDHCELTNRSNGDEYYIGEAMCYIQRAQEHAELSTDIRFPRKDDSMMTWSQVNNTYLQVGLV